MASTAQKEALASNVTFCLGDPIIKVTAPDGTVAAYAPHTRYLEIGGVTYSPYYPVDPARPSAKVGLEPDSAEFIAPFDEIITKANCLPNGGIWRGGRAYTAYVVDYRNLSLGVVQEHEWLIGKVKPKGSMFTMELLGKRQALRQTIGASTQPVDRNRTPEELGVEIEDYTFAAEVTAVTDRRIFTVDVSQADVGGVPYFRYGRARWLTGANADLEMEVEDNAGTLITLQLPMRSDIKVADTLELIAGYDGTREQARDKFDAAEAMDAEPDLPGLSKVLEYPQ
jgi:uncharacterized phage protein (TIGR02218 family)